MILSFPGTSSARNVGIEDMADLLRKGLDEIEKAYVYFVYALAEAE